MNIRLLLILLFLSTFIGYLEWGQGNSMFLIQAEFDIVKKFGEDPLSVLHPFTLIPFAGQLLILFTVFQKQPRKIIVFIGMGCIGLLLLLMTAIGLMSLNYKILISTAPFLVTSFFIIRYFRKQQ